MVALFLRGEPLTSAGGLADIQAVLFDKDGTMSRSESRLLALATTRIRHCLQLAEERETLPAELGSVAHGSPELGSAAIGTGELEPLLRRAYGLLPAQGALDPAGVTAVAARDHNLLSTAVALAQVGHGWPESLEIAQEAFRRADLDHPPSASGSETTEGLPHLLAALQEREVLCAVISNDDCSGIESFLQHHGLSQRISAIWSAEHHPRKPDPQAIAHLCQHLGVAPANCALVGDANSDLRMGQAAGVAVVLGYRGGWQRPVRLEGAFPQLDHWRELTLEGGLQPDPGVSTEIRGPYGKT